MSELLSIKIYSQSAGMNLVDFLSNRFTYQSSQEWKDWIEAETILISGKKIDTEYRLKEEDEITFDISLIPEPEVNKDYKIIYEDNWIFAVDKPANLPVHPTGRYRKHNLTSFLKQEQTTNFYIVNRLDRETSGIVLFAKTSEIAGMLGKLFSNRKIHKEYIVYVYGLFPEYRHLKGKILPDEHSIIRKKKKFIEMDYIETLPDYSETYLERIDYKDGISKLLAKPKTGRIHQIRATLFSIGFPVVGDKIYGKDEHFFIDFLEKGEEIYSNPSLYPDIYKIKRQALHAYSLNFIHPITKESIYINSPEPKDMIKILSVL